MWRRQRYNIRWNTSRWFGKTMACQLPIDKFKQLTTRGSKINAMNHKWTSEQMMACHTLSVAHRSAEHAQQRNHIHNTKWRFCRARRHNALQTCVYNQVRQPLVNETMVYERPFKNLKALEDLGRWCEGSLDGETSCCGGWSDVDVEHGALYTRFRPAFQCRQEIFVEYYGFFMIATQ